MSACRPNPRNSRRERGVFYTPEAVSQFIVRQSVEPLWREQLDRHSLPVVRVLDPACGTGALLVEAYRSLLEARLQWRLLATPDESAPRGHLLPLAGAPGAWRLSAAERRQVLLEQVFGVELDPLAAHAARLALAELALSPRESSSPSAASGYALDSLLADLEANIRTGDALVGEDARRAEFSGLKGAPRPRPIHWRQAFPQVLELGKGFDAIVMNPPYVNIRRLSRTYHAGLKRYLARRYRSARGNYDLYVLFVELAHELLRPGGMCGMIAPNKLATLDYAAACRDLLLHQTTLHCLADVSRLGVFPGAGVYPHITVWENQPAPPEHEVRLWRPATWNDLAQAPQGALVQQRELALEGRLSGEADLEVELRAPTEPLGSRASIHSGATGFSAAQLAGQLVEFQALANAEAAHEFIVSGNIDRYLIEPGNVRFIKRTFSRPMLPEAADSLSAKKRRLYAGSKIVLAGMTRRLEAAYDAGGLALGVQVYAVAEWQDDPFYLLALLNSKLLSYLFRTRFRAKELAGGYLAINKGQLAKLPIRLIDEARLEDRELRDTLARLAANLQSLYARQRHESHPAERRQLALLIDSAERRIDEHVYRAYRLTLAEIERVEKEFETAGGASARAGRRAG